MVKKINNKKPGKQNPNKKSIKKSSGAKQNNLNNLKAKKPFKKAEKTGDEEIDNTNMETSNEADFYLDEGNLYSDDEEKAGEDGSLQGSELDFDEEDYIESESEKSEEEVKKKPLTIDELKRIMKKTYSGTTFALSKIISIFAKVTNQKVDNLDEDDILNKSKVVAKIIKFSIKSLPEILLLKYNSLETNENKGSIKGLIHRFLSSLAKFLKNAEKSMISFLFKYIDNISQLVVIFKNLIEIYLKILLKIWSSNAKNKENSLQVVKFILFRKPEYFDMALKLFYINYLEVAKAMNWNSVAKIEQLQNDIIDILQLDYQRAYTVIFAFIRKLCLQLRTTINDKKANSIKNIYNWQFINSLALWTRAVCSYFGKNDCEITLLAYPLIQTILGVIRLNLVDIFYPLRLYLVRLLNNISEVSGIFIPSGSYILEILESNHFSKKFKEKSSENENNWMNFSINLKIKKEEFKKYSVNYQLLEDCLDCLTEYLAINSYKYTFPEVAFVISHHLKKIRGEFVD
jgi:nucleolar complex protein 2